MEGIRELLQAHGELWVFLGKDPDNKKCFAKELQDLGSLFEVEGKPVQPEAPGHHR